MSPADRARAELRKLAGKNAPADVDDHHRLAEDLGLDSLDVVTAMVELEDQLGITLEDYRFDEARTVGDFVAAVVHCAGALA